VKRTRLEVPGVLSAAELDATVDAIGAVQQPNGFILWYSGGHADPWNHVEAAMALDIGGRHTDARRAYEWLADHQRADGSWFEYYTADGIEDPKFDANTIAYIATGALHHLMTTGDETFALEVWPTVEKAIDWVLDLQQPDGAIIWARHPDGTPFDYALLTGSSSMAHSLGSALTFATRCGKDRPDWKNARDRLAHAVAHSPASFEPKDRWAMDWYYPVLAGVVRGAAAADRLNGSWDRFVMDGEGVRCVDDQPWVTTGETAELAIACAAVGWNDRACDLLRWSRQLRHHDGAYWTGLHVPDRVFFPADERTSYSAAAVVLAADAIAGTNAASRIFHHS
jgi:hypothetical protein